MCTCVYYCTYMGIIALRKQKKYGSSYDISPFMRLSSCLNLTEPGVVSIFFYHLFGNVFANNLAGTAPCGISVPNCFKLRKMQYSSWTWKHSQPSMTTGFMFWSIERPHIHVFSYRILAYFVRSFSLLFLFKRAMDGYGNIGETLVLQRKKRNWFEQEDLEQVFREHNILKRRIENRGFIAS